MRAWKVSKLNVEDFRVRPNERDFDLERFPTELRGVYVNKSDYQSQLRDEHVKLTRFQAALFASRARALLAAFQGDNGSGKSSITRRVCKGLNSKGCENHSFRSPSAEDFEFSWLQRHYEALPPRGKFSFWDRTHYEEVGAVRVNPSFLKARGLKPSHFGKRAWKERYKDIRQFEEYQHRNGVTIVKFYLHVSKHQQAVRLLERYDNPEKHWKLSLQDLKDRDKFEENLKVYSEAIPATSTKHAPWYIIPSDDKRAAAILIAKILNHHLQEINPRHPRMGPKERKEFDAMIKQLRREVKAGNQR